jgi:hypothetical protein
MHILRIPVNRYFWFTLDMEIRRVLLKENARRVKDPKPCTGDKFLHMGEIIGPGDVSPRRKEDPQIAPLFGKPLESVAYCS